MRPSLLAAVLAALALALPLLVGAPPAAAAGTAADREAAAAFGAAADRFDAAARQAAPEIQRRLEVLADPACERAFKRAPKRRRAVVLQFAVALGVDAVFTPLRPAVETFVAELDAVATEDRALRSGRSAWRSTLAIFAVAEPVPADVCAQLDAWRRAGYPKDALPAIPRMTTDELDALTDAGQSIDRKLRRAARRLRRLGVSRATARRFSGRSLGEVFEGTFAPEKGA